MTLSKQRRNISSSIERNERIARWNLWSVRGVSHRLIASIAEQGPIAELWSLDPPLFEQRIDVGDPGPTTRERIVELITDGRAPEARYRRELECLPERAQLLHISDEAYPERLLALTAPPTFLYVWGDPDAGGVRHTLATVGTRSVGVDDARRASEIVRRVVEADVAIVSGGANGVDTVAHETCLEAGVPTVAFMPGGFDQLTPKSNTDLFERITHRGALMTEYPMGTDVRRYHFPRRNRLIAALGDGTFVVRGDVDSGTMLTAEAALDLGRPIGALVGGLDEPLAAGCLKLIVEEGAQALRDGDDVLDHLLDVLRQPPPSSACESASDDVESHSIDSEKDDSASSPPSGSISPPETLSEEASELLEAASRLADGDASDPLHIDRLSRAADRDPDAIQSSLLELELYGLVSKAPGAQAYTFHATVEPSST